MHDLNAHVKPIYTRYREFPLFMQSRCARRKQQAVPCQTENAAAQKYFSQLIGSSLNVKVDWIEKNIQSLMGKIFTHDEARNNFPATFGFSNIEEIFLFPCFTSRISL